MIRTNKYSKALAALFAVVMVVSMMAPVAGASVAADAGDAEANVEGDLDAADIDADSTVADTDENLTDQQDPDEVSIDEALEDDFASGDGDVEVVVRFDSADTDGAMTEDEAVGSMQAHADQTQEDLLRFAERHPGIEVKNTFWLANAVLIDVDPDRATLEEIAAVENVDRLHTNFELTTMDGNSTDGNSTDGEESDSSESSPENGTEDESSANES
ncbi:serine protease, partial [Halorubrum sp. AD140]|nr:serine protease [Halorubrum sp. AD140]